MMMLFKQNKIVMNKVKIKKYILSCKVPFKSLYKVLALVLTLSSLGACSKIDEYRETYFKDGPIIYTSKMDSVEVFSGKGRVLIQGLFISDPNIKTYKIFWNGGQDSLEMPVSRTDKVDTASVLIEHLPEGQMGFEIITYDGKGHRSVPVHVTGSVYGDYYQSALVNRGIEKAALNDEGAALIQWADVSQEAGGLYMEVSYEDADNMLRDTVIASLLADQETVLPNFKLGSSIRYKTAYLPAPGAIDTFFVAEQTHSVEADVTALYLSNVGPGFVPESPGGRWGVLGAPWLENEAAKNKDGGLNGGFTSDSRWGYNGQLNWETWGSTPVVDGKLYQVSSKELPAGNYTVSFQYYSEIQSNSSVYCIVAAGDQGIPSLEGLSGALGYSMLYNGANPGSTGPSLEEIKSFSFSLDSPTKITLGFLGNLLGNGDPGNYFVVGYIKLIQN